MILGARDRPDDAVRVKICGITRPADAALAAQLGADAIGLVLWPGSPRFVDLPRAASVMAAVPPDVIAVGVFVDQPPELVLDTAARLGLRAVQLHGHEDVSCYLDRTPVIKTVPVAGAAAVRRATALPARVTVLLDAHDPVRHGGTGHVIDHRIAARISARRPVILAGGLNAENLAAAIAAVRPAGVDVSSGVEERPGIKSPDRLRAFFAAVRGASEASA